MALLTLGVLGIFVSVTVAQLQLPSATTCDGENKINAVEILDLKGLQKVWYEQEKYQSSNPDLPGECVNVEYTLMSDNTWSTLIRFVDSSTNNSKAWLGRTVTLDPPNAKEERNGNIQLTLDITNTLVPQPKITRTYRSKIIAVDYTQYLIIYSCGVGWTSPFNSDGLWVLTRNKEYLDEVKAEVRKILTSLKLSTDRLSPSNQKCTPN